MRLWRFADEEEWEYACRAGTDTQYWSGNKEKDLEWVGWYAANSHRRTHAVGEKPANPWGLYDVHGNAREWTLSRWSANFGGREIGVTVNPSTIREGLDLEVSQNTRLVLRGGGCWSSADETRAAFRESRYPNAVFAYRGFRALLEDGSQC
jgi:formylglycine-generating enzyme required for sulfatase activity